jgi:hypothetical protein
MTTIINAVSGTGLTQSADGSGVLKVQSNGSTTNALAWVNFVGSTGAVTASYNIGSVTRNATGDYTLNFTASLSDTNYVVLGASMLDTVSLSASAYFAGVRGTSGTPTTKTTAAVRVATVTQGGTSIDIPQQCFVIFGN